MDNTQEEWKVIENCSNYMISNFGKVKNISLNKILKGGRRFGYVVYTIRNNDGITTTINAHVVVATIFIPNPQNKPYVNHKDENKSNPHISNLEWVTPKENTNYGSCPDKISRRLSVPINEYDFDGHYIRTWKSSQHASLVYGVTARVIQNASQISKSSLDCKTSCGRQWRVYKGNTCDIEPIISKHVLTYIKNANYNIVVPDDYLYVDMAGEHEKCINAIEEAIGNDMLSQYQSKNLQLIRDYLMRQCG